MQKYFFKIIFLGKEVEKSFQSSLNGLIKNEKNLEQNPDYLMKANSLIFDHLIRRGQVEVAETFIKVSQFFYHFNFYDIFLAYLSFLGMRIAI